MTSFSIEGEVFDARIHNRSVSVYFRDVRTVDDLETVGGDLPNQEEGDVPGNIAQKIGEVLLELSQILRADAENWLERSRIKKKLMV